jgi:hypothetical protein
MGKFPENWDIVDRKVNVSLAQTVSRVIAIIVLSFLPGSSYFPFYDSTWTLRNKLTGAVKRVTADNEDEAAIKTKNEWFDPD